MNDHRQVEVQYINTGFPYTIPGSFMDLFEGLTYAQADVALAEALQDQGNPYWSMMHTNSYKYGFSGSGSNSYYNFSHEYEVNDYLPRLDGGRRQWENPSSGINIDLPQPILQGNGGTDAGLSPTPEECIRDHHNAGNPQQVIWQDNIDPDNMTYEDPRIGQKVGVGRRCGYYLEYLHVPQSAALVSSSVCLSCLLPICGIDVLVVCQELLDLGEAVGTQSRGLSQERISSLPVSKYKCSFFSRKKTRRERCVICQMDYKRGDRQMSLPCKHVYHSGCVTKWLSINKACPVCFVEVSNDEPRHQSL